MSGVSVHVLMSRFCASLRVCTRAAVKRCAENTGSERSIVKHFCAGFSCGHGLHPQKTPRDHCLNLAFDEVMLDGDLAWEGCARNSGVVKVIEKHLRGGRRAGTACAKTICTSVCVCSRQMDLFTPKHVFKKLAFFARASRRFFILEGGFIQHGWISVPVEPLNFLYACFLEVCLSV